MCEADLDRWDMIDVIQMILHEGEHEKHWAWEVVKQDFFIKWMVFFGQEDRKFVRDYFRRRTDFGSHQQRMLEATAREFEELRKRSEGSAIEKRDLQVGVKPSVEITDESILQCFPEGEPMRFSRFMKHLNITQLGDARQLELRLKDLITRGLIEKIIHDGNVYYKRI